MSAPCYFLISPGVPVLLRDKFFESHRRASRLAATIGCVVSNAAWLIDHGAKITVTLRTFEKHSPGKRIADRVTRGKFVDLSPPGVTIPRGEQLIETVTFNGVALERGY